MNEAYVVKTCWNNVLANNKILFVLYSDYTYEVFNFGSEYIEDKGKLGVVKLCQKKYTKQQVAEWYASFEES